MDCFVTLQGQGIAHLLSEDLHITRELYSPSVLGIFFKNTVGNKLQEHLEKTLKQTGLKREVNVLEVIS